MISTLLSREGFTNRRGFLRGAGGRTAAWIGVGSREALTGLIPCCVYRPSGRREGSDDYLTVSIDEMHASRQAYAATLADVGAQASKA